MSIPTWQEAAEDEFWERVPTDLHEDGVRHYLGTYGDAIDARVSKQEAMAADLLAKNFAGPSIAASMTALELMVQYFCIRPIIQGSFLSDLIASEVAKKVIDSRSCDHNNLLVPLLKPWGVDLNAISVADGERLWEQLQSLRKVRNAFVHRGDDVTLEQAALTIKCVTAFRKEVVAKIAGRLNFTIDKSGCWARVVHEPNGHSFLGGETGYTKRDPFV